MKKVSVIFAAAFITMAFAACDAPGHGPFKDRGFAFPPKNNVSVPIAQDAYPAVGGVDSGASPTQALPPARRY